MIIFFLLYVINLLFIMRFFQICKLSKTEEERIYEEQEEIKYIQEYLEKKKKKSNNFLIKNY